jgi:hypothetical protein
MVFDSLGRTPARDAEIIVENVTMEAGSARRQVAQGEAHVEDLVVEGEIADRHPVELVLVGPVALAQLGALRLQLVAGGFALPVGFLRELQLALGADAREAEIMGGDHVGGPVFL